MATIYDVARVAGVSPKTVSRVLNGDGPVGKSTRSKVEQAMSALGYSPSSAARMMRSNHSGLIGLITGAISHSPDTTEPGGLPDLFIVKGIQSVIADSGMTLMIADTGGRLDRVAALMRTFQEHRVEGLIYAAEYHQEVALPPVPDNFPLVLANCYDQHGTAAVVPDDRRGQFDLVSQLIQKGHRRIGYLTLQSGMVAGRLRVQGYREALAASGIDYDASLVTVGYLESDGKDSQLLWDAIDRLLRLPEPPSVLCCGNDEMALRVYGILRARGVRVPEDMSVAGFDNYRVIAETLYPPLTTVELAYAAIGARAAQRLLSLISGEPEEQTNPTLVSGPVSWRSSVTVKNSLHMFESKGRINL